MAAKNEIKHRISLEGDDDVKRRLKAVGEAGKQALADTEKRLGAARSFAERQSAGGPAIGALNKLRAPAEVLGGALSPFAEGAGVAGIVGRLKGFLTSPAGIFGSIAAALSGIALHLAKVADETDRVKGRFKALGDEKGLEKVSEQAKKLGTDVSGLKDRREGFLAYQQQLTAQNRSVIHPPGFVPGSNEEAASGVRILGAGPSSSPPSREAFQAFDRALFEQIRRDVGKSEDAAQIAKDFEQNLFKSGLTSDALQSLQKSSPNAANFVTNSLSQLLGRGFSNPNELAAQIDRGAVKVGAPDLIREGAKAAPQADKEAEAARGVTEALEGAKASIGRFDKAVSEAAGGAQISKGIAGAVDKATGTVNGAAEGLPGFIQKVIDASQQKGAAFQQANPFISETNRYTGPVKEPEPEPAPPAPPQFRPDRTLDGLQIAPPQPQPVQPPEQHSAIDDNRQNIAENTSALSASTDGLQRFASAVDEATSRVQGSGNNAGAGSSDAAHFATGGPVRNLDGGGHISGPGTTTSDSIPAMLSDKEYVIKASSAKKVGRNFLDWLNAGAQGFADGGSVIGSSTGGVLGPGSHDITYDPLSGGAYIDGNLHLPGDPILDDPIVKQAMQESMRGMGQQPSQKKHKSDFTGIFGGHVFDTPGSFAAGGAVGSIPSLRSYFARFADGGSVAGGLNIGAAALPQISMPTLDFGDVPDFGDLGAPSGSPWDMSHLGSMDLRTDHGDARVMGPANVLRQMTAAARDSANARIGRAPSWVYGQGR